MGKPITAAAWRSLPTLRTRRARLRALNRADRYALMFMARWRGTSSSHDCPISLEFTDGGTVRHCPLPSVVSVNGAESFVAAARLGLGLIQAPRYHLESDL